MKQYAEISNLEKDYDIILTNPSVLNLQQKAHGLLELALSYEREGVKERSLSYYNQAMEKHNDLLLEAYKTVSLQYMLEVKKLLNMTPRSRLFMKAERLLEEAKESYLTAKNLRDELSMQSKVYYQLSIKSLAESYNLLKT